MNFFSSYYLILIVNLGVYDLNSNYKIQNCVMYD